MHIKKLIFTFIYLFILEIIFIISTTKIYGNIILISLFSLLISFFISIISNLFNNRINKIIYNIFIILIFFIFNIYIIYYKMFNNILTINTIINSYKAIPFINILFKEIIKYCYIIILNIGILSVMIYLQKYFNFNKNINIKYIISFIINYIIIIIIILCSNNKLYSAKNLYFKINNNIENSKQFGLLTTIRLDIERSIFNFKEKNIIDNNKNNIDNEDNYHILDLKLNSNNDIIKDIYEYIINREVTEKNDYTGLFKNKNIIFVVAESFSNMAIRKDLTPTLYKMQQEGINFRNYYAPLFSIGTSDSEYVLDNSLYPADGEWSMEKSFNNYLYSYPNLLENRGYKTYAYHNYSYDYYNRYKYINNIGYDSFLACGNGLEKKINCKLTPPSDYEMFKNTMDDYLHENKFMAYYITMSGHRDYNKNNSIVKKNWDKVKNLKYNDNIKGYLASQIELDKALEEVLKRLEKENKLKDTIIVLTGDHYPVGLSFNELQELSNNTLDTTFEKYHMPFIIYNSEINNINVDKYCSSIDVLPTILNLMGIEYDSRLYMGNDIFSNIDDLVVFSDRSFITNKGRYNELSEYYTGQNIDDNYISNIQNIIYNKFKYSRLILENNFYKYITIDIK